MNIEEVLKKYFELDQREAEMSKRHAEEMKPLSEGKAAIKNWFLHQMNETGSDQFKVKGVGMAFKSTQTSCQMQDAAAFKQFAFAPVPEAIRNYLESCGIDMLGIDFTPVENIIRDLVRWDMVDFRAGKKGVQEYIELEKKNVPGVAVNSIATVSIRKASA